MNTRIVKRSINRFIILAGVIPSTFLRVYPSYAIPPHDKSFPGKQKIDHSFEERDLLRIWIVKIRKEHAKHRA